MWACAFTHKCVVGQLTLKAAAMTTVAADLQTGCATARQGHRQVEPRTDRKIHRQTETQTDRKTHRLTDPQKGMDTDRFSHGPTGRPTDRQAGPQTSRDTDREKHRRWLVFQDGVPSLMCSCCKTHTCTSIETPWAGRGLAGCTNGLPGYMGVGVCEHV